MVRIRMTDEEIINLTSEILKEMYIAADLGISTYTSNDLGLFIDENNLFGPLVEKANELWKKEKKKPDYKSRPNTDSFGRSAPFDLGKGKLDDFAADKHDYY